MIRYVAIGAVVGFAVAVFVLSRQTDPPQATVIDQSKLIELNRGTPQEKRLDPNRLQRSGAAFFEHPASPDASAP
jgi:hypothetical protein